LHPHFNVLFEVLFLTSQTAESKGPDFAPKYSLQLIRCNPFFSARGKHLLSVTLDSALINMLLKYLFTYSYISIKNRKKPQADLYRQHLFGKFMQLKRAVSKKLSLVKKDFGVFSVNSHDYWQDLTWLRGAPKD
jgi:hypothetical protein